MKIKLFDNKENKTEWDIEMWDCMKIGFFSGLGWTLVWIGIYAVLLILIFIFGAI